MYFKFIFLFRSVYVLGIINMRRRYIDLTTSTSSSTNEKNDFYVRSHFRWESIKKFVYFAHAFSSTIFSFDMFSKVLVVKAHLLEYTIVAVFIGVSYMFMDFFIKQYTRRLDTNKNLNPLLKGVSFGILLQTALWTILHASSLADSLRFFLVSVNKSPNWSKCQKMNANLTCLSSQDVIVHCRNKVSIDMKITSAHVNYMKLFSNDKNSLSMRVFMIAIVWIGNFFIATLTDNALLMIFKFSFLWGTFSTAFILMFLLFSSPYASRAFYQIMEIRNFFHRNAFNLVTDPFGVGLIGVYDFGMMSPFTMIDNAILIFAAVFIATAFARSLIVRILYLELMSCVDVRTYESPHYLLFALLPLSSEFMSAHKIFVIYIYSYLTAALVACLAMFTSIVSRFLHAEFRSIKSIYIVGLVCFLGFNLSVPLSALPCRKLAGILFGLNACSVYFGGVKVAIVMWLYGVRTFSMDVHFWLGFKPTPFWKCIWAVLPIVLLTISFVYVVSISNMDDTSQRMMALTWIVLSLLIQNMINIKVVANYIMKNNIVGVLKSNFKYGPPDLDDRKKRKNFDETTQSRQCRHNCMVLDDKYECNHLPLMYKSRSDVQSSESSLTNIFEGSSKKRTSSVIDVSALHVN